MLGADSAGVAACPAFAGLCSGPVACAGLAFTAAALLRYTPEPLDGIGAVAMGLLRARSTVSAIPARSHIMVLTP